MKRRIMFRRQARVATFREAIASNCEGKRNFFAAETSITMPMKNIRTALILLLITVNALGSQEKQAAVTPQSTQAAQSPVDKSEAYYHYALARSLEEKATSPGAANPQTIMSQAVDEMKLAVQ